MLTHGQWNKLAERIKQDYPPSVYLIRDKMQRVLGFVSRLHRTSNYDSLVYLDFYDEPKKTMFLLKYSEYLGNAKDI